MRYLSRVGTRPIPQGAPLPGSGQKPNRAAGYVWAVDDWKRLDRFLILGSEGGTYYITERGLTLENANAVRRCIERDGLRAVQRIVEVSEAGRAPKNDPAIFALAMAASYGDDETRRAALAALPRVCRIGTHLFHFSAYVEQFRGWGRGLRNAVGQWYAGQSERELAYQAVKYQARDGWSHRDLLRLAHPKTEGTRQTLYHWMVKGWEGVGEDPHPDEDVRIVWAFERAKRAQSADETVRLIRDFRLPREAVPTQWLTDAGVWEALLDEMPMTALIRNLATMTRVGLIAPNSETTRRVVDELGNQSRLKRARVHPIAVLAALKTYAAGHGERGRNTWTPVQSVVDALDGAFYAAFASVQPTGQRWLLGLDVSGSMSSGTVAGVPGLTPRVASAAMALVTAATERNHQFMAFCDRFVPLKISPRQRLDDVVKATDGLPFGGTDCALPMIWAREQKVPVDVFAIYTDSETWFGGTHPVVALQQYREQMGIPAKLVVVGMVSNGFSIADPNDVGMLDVVGFDSSAPELLRAFAVGEV
jgi:60 kDa SS-A/Ro ribonucleoprotein